MINICWGNEHNSLPVGMPHPSRQTLSSGAVGLIYI